jgi:hypothetical protein
VPGATYLLRDLSLDLSWDLSRDLSLDLSRDLLAGLGLLLRLALPPRDLGREECNFRLVEDSLRIKNRICRQPLVMMISSRFCWSATGHDDQQPVMMISNRFCWSATGYVVPEPATLVSNQLWLVRNRYRRSGTGSVGQEPVL